MTVALRFGLTQCEKSDGFAFSALWASRTHMPFQCAAQRDGLTVFISKLAACSFRQATRPQARGKDYPSRNCASSRASDISANLG